ncbi:MAG: alkaline phosphatase family protein [Thermoproteota archaeon]
MQNKNKLNLMVLGFDGASPHLINQWTDDLPMFKRFKEDGVFGQTIPPVPAQTPVAWTSFFTGKNPGNHDVFSFATRRIGTYEREIISPEMVKSKTIWRILSESGKTVGVINVPMSDMEEVRGFIIPGFMSRSEGVPHPDSLGEKVRRGFKLDRLIGDVETEVLDRVGSDPDLFFERVNQITDEMADVSLSLFQEEACDFFMVVFMGMDRIQHFFWRYVDKNHPEYEENEYTKLVKDFYIKADKIIGRFLNLIEKDTVVMVVSDHGFCPIHKEVIVNNYLEELGFLETKNGMVDVERSRAVSYGYGDIWLNVEGREPNGFIKPGEEYEEIRNEIISRLKGLKVDGEIPFKHVRKREEIYWGTYLSEAPDLTIIFNMGWQAARRPEIAERNASGRYVNDHPRWSGGHDGTHDPNDVPGVLAVLGPGIINGRGVRVSLWDIAPTILSLMDVAVPGDMDGRALSISRRKTGS